MKYETLIFSGCSHSFGSGMMNEDFNELIKEYGSLKNAPVEWCNPKCYEDFPNVVSVDDATEAIKQRAYPHQIGKQLGFKNTYNLSVQGGGIEIQLRNVSSFIIENENKIDFSKSVFCYQLPSLTRIEILKNANELNLDKFSWMNFNFSHLSDNEEYGLDFFIRHFDFDFYIAKFLMYLYEYKGFLNSKGIEFLPFEFIPDGIMKNMNKLFPYQREESVIQKIMNYRQPWTHYRTTFPTREELINKIEFWEPNFQLLGLPETLKSEGYCNDNHWSPKGHDRIAKALSIELKQKLKI